MEGITRSLFVKASMDFECESPSDSSCMLDEILDDALKGHFVASAVVPAAFPVLQRISRLLGPGFELPHVIPQFLVGEVGQGGLGGAACESGGRHIQSGRRRRPFPAPSSLGRLLPCLGGALLVTCPITAVRGRPSRAICFGCCVGRWEDQLLLLRGRKNLVEVDGHAERDQEQTTGP